VNSLRPKATILKGDVPKTLLKVVRRYPPLSREKQVELFLKAKEGDAEAREILILSNLTFVFRVARSYTFPVHLEFDDLIQAGIDGIIHAIDRFNPHRKFSFTTYAYCWVRKFVSECITSNISVIKVPHPCVYEIQSLRKKADKLSNETGYVIDDSLDLADGAAMSYDILRATRNAVENFAPLDTVSEPLLSNSSSNNAERFELDAKVEAALAALTPMEQDIIKRLFGLGCEPQTLSEIATHFILHKERVRQIKKIALEKMRRALGVLPPPEPDLFSSTES
jgi:RNA polymerase primary sigma factor